MSKKKIALLILTTSYGRNNWNSIKDTYFYNLSLKTFLLTQNTEYEYIFYININLIGDLKTIFLISAPSSAKRAKHIDDEKKMKKKLIQ